MKTFAELNITVKQNGFIGQKIKISKLFNKQIEIHAFKVEPSKKNENILLTLQVKIDDELRVVFCGSQHLKNILECVPPESFPFVATITNDNSGYSLQ